MTALLMYPMESRPASVATPVATAWTGNSDPGRTSVPLWSVAQPSQSLGRNRHAGVSLSRSEPWSVPACAVPACAVPACAVPACALPARTQPARWPRVRTLPAEAMIGAKAAGHVDAREHRHPPLRPDHIKNPARTHDASTDDMKGGGRWAMWCGLEVNSVRRCHRAEAHSFLRNFPAPAVRGDPV